MWHNLYLSLHSLNSQIPEDISNNIPFKKNFKSIFTKKIKFNKSDDKLLYDKRSIIRIQKFFIKDNYKFKNKYKINYL